MKHETMNLTVSDRLAHTLAEVGVTHVFGVISIHNMPLLDAIDRAGVIRFVPARGEAGAMNMADAFSRVSGGLGVCLTSTGTAAGNAAGGQAEALVAGSRLLHITTQVDAGMADRDRAAIHDVPRQPRMLEGVSKAVIRAWDANGAVGALLQAIALCRAAPSGPVSLELPVDVQRAACILGQSFPGDIASVRAADASLAALVKKVRAARRPMLWLGGGAREATGAVARLAARGIGIVSSTQGRGIFPEDRPGSLGAFNMTPEAAALYETCDLMIVAGSRLRGNETRNNKLPLPPLAQIDADASQLGRNYAVDLAVQGDAADVLDRLDTALGDYAADPTLAHDVTIARAKSEGRLRVTLGPYQVIADVLARIVPEGRHPWVRDVTISNSTFGNRYIPLTAPHLGVHALGGGIGQGIAMGIGAALASDTKAITLVGDGGAQLGLAELATAVQERAPLVYVLMNDRAYGVIQNIQNAQYNGRQSHSALLTPDFEKVCASIGLAHHVVRDVAEFEHILVNALGADGPVMVEVDMTSIGPFAEAFAGPPAGAAQK
ncbi:thiamine pyrophosphate-binding protein [Thalassococcus sp. S3]|uniref:thiamine pyrophosphate-binding protein n=1 Tax=Thalassococcus sp. S3 TaxID=2017482 RepID=UPI0010244D1F|nr:thiamine pyrophosphate-binding protein [Thalassococcus sp. S3]QBF33436.1 hypothetical protein CFI11_19800 [Thalassococcus sp. S3]